MTQPPLTRAQRAADAVSAFCGSWTFIIAFSAITLCWMAFNTFKIFTTFDPYPYILLNLFLTVVSTFQSPLIMMSQNRQMERDRDAVQGLHDKLDEMRGAKATVPSQEKYGEIERDIEYALGQLCLKHGPLDVWNAISVQQNRGGRK